MCTGPVANRACAPERHAPTSCMDAHRNHCADGREHWPPQSKRQRIARADPMVSVAQLVLEVTVDADL